MGMGTVVLVFVNNARAEYLASREVQGYGKGTYWRAVQPLPR